MTPYPYHTLLEPEDNSSYSFLQDISLLQAYYPKAARRIQQEVEEECDKLEYEGSYLFHQTPDRVSIEQTVSEIYRRLSSIDSEEQALTANQFSVPDFHPDKTPDWLKNLITVMFLNEMAHRRYRYHDRKRQNYLY